MGVLVAGLIFAVWLPAQGGVAQAPTLLQKVEAQRGQPLTFEQRREFSRTAGGLGDALLPAQYGFVHTVARVTGLPEAEVRAMLPAIGADTPGLDRNMLAQLEARLNRAVTPQELQQLRAADNTKKAELSGIQSRYADELAQIAGLSKARIQRMLPTIGI